MNFQCDLEITTSSTFEKPSSSRVAVLTEDSREAIVGLLLPNFDWVFLTAVNSLKSLTRATPRRGSRGRI